LDRAILTGNLNKVKDIYNGTNISSSYVPADATYSSASSPRSSNSPLPLTQQLTQAITPCRRFSRWGARCMVRFAYIHILDWLYSVNPEHVHNVCDELLPEVASAWGRVEVLDWAYRKSTFGIQKVISPRAMDDASRNGHVDVLQWWLTSGIQPLAYSEDALNHATIKLQIPTLEWWKHSGLPLKIGNVMDFASMVKSPSTASLDWWKSQIDSNDIDAIFANVSVTASGRRTGGTANSAPSGLYTKLALYQLSNTGNIPLLNWWKDSGLPLVYDKEVLIGATKQGRVESLNWWLKSKLPISYTVFDIE
jgi:hypothetical protein